MFKNKTVGLGIVMVALFMTIMPAARIHAAQTGDTAAHITKIQTKADQEITRRIDKLNEVIGKVNDMKKISDTDKSALVAKAQTNIDMLTTLKAKIDADTDLTVLKTDVQSITKSYRIFMLIHPQIRIEAAADRMDVTADMLTDVASKLQTRITAAQAAGKDVSAFNASVADMKVKIADAHTQYANADAAVSNLVPDNGDQATMTANKTALTNAKGMIKTGATDLKAARALAKSVNDGLKALGF